MNNPPLRWGVAQQDSSGMTNLAVYNELQPGDFVYFYATQDQPTPFSKQGLFGVGQVVRKPGKSNDLYWPKEKSEKRVIWSHRFEIEFMKLILVARNALLLYFISSAVEKFV